MLKNIPIILTIIFGMTINSFGGTTPLKIKKIDNNLLVNILNNSEVKRLDPSIKSEPINSLLYLKLYSLPVSSNCAPETHAICSYHYYLAVSEEGAAPRQALFDLGESGYLIKAKPLPVKRDTEARFQFFFQKAYGVNPDSWTTTLHIQPEFVKEIR